MPVLKTVVLCLFTGRGRMGFLMAWTHRIRPHNGTLGGWSSVRMQALALVPAPSPRSDWFTCVKRHSHVNWSSTTSPGTRTGPQCDVGWDHDVRGQMRVPSSVKSQLWRDWTRISDTPLRLLGGPGVGANLESSKVWSGPGVPTRFDRPSNPGSTINRIFVSVLIRSGRMPTQALVRPSQNCRARQIGQESK